ncbi:putative subtilisin-like protease precursor [Neoconidiobolus thromboides FSU 785]|nr:putative subtilisin-like protease precursor [Neoconidiobolus thromboides FSU 785]
MKFLPSLFFSNLFIHLLYIIKLKDTNRITLDSHLNNVRSLFKNRSEENKINHVYNSLGSFYSAQFSKEIIAQIRSLPEISYIENDSIVKIYPSENADTLSINSVQPNAPWNLARISQRKLVNSDYTYLGDGSGVSVYIADTGVYTSHPEFEGRAIVGANFSSDTNNNDGNGHGTFVAGVVGAKTYGVAKKTQLISVKVLDTNGSGSISGILAGVNWVVKDKRGKKGNVLNLSIGGGFSQPLNDAVKSAHQNGVTVVTAAGNSNSDGCSFSPGSTPEAINVATLSTNDARSSASNYGKCIDIFAPGQNIVSTWNNNGLQTLTGSSTAAPHVAGLAAYFYSLEALTPDTVTQKILALATIDLVTNPGSQSPNRIAFNGAI